MTEPAAVATEIKNPPAAAAAAAPELVEVKIGNQTFKLEKGAAAALKQASDASTAALAAATERAAKAEAAAKPAKADPEATEENYDQLFTNPKEFLAKFEQGIVAKVTAQYTQTEGQKAFWSEFYGAHPDLKEHDLFVKTILGRDLKTLTAPGVTVADAVKTLGETVKGEILKIKGQKGSNDSRPRTEGGTTGGGAQSKPVSEDSPTKPNGSLTSLLKQRQEARRTGGKAAQATT